MLTGSAMDLLISHLTSQKYLLAMYYMCLIHTFQA